MARTAEPALVMALESFVGELGGRPVVVHRGDLADVDSPVVKKWPKAFGPVQVVHRATAPRVEAATAAPGEKRGE